MTYDELLANIDDQEYAYDNLAEALLAVVKLHKPIEGYCEACFDTCWTCSEWGCKDNCECICHPKYPCPTIQAIEKELNS